MMDCYQSEIRESFNFFIYCFKFILLIISFYGIICSLFLKEVEVISKYSHFVFTFWEPNNSVPGYLSLCMKTWKKYIPSEYKIVILDYSNLRDYLGIKLFNLILCKDMTFAMQTDAIRIAILNKYGGFWMDFDTLILNSKFIKMFYGSDFIMFRQSKPYNKHYSGFIYASSNSTILKAYFKAIIYKVRLYKYRLLLYRFFHNKYFAKLYEESRHWSYLSTSIIEDLAKNTSEKEFKHIEIDNAYALPDLTILEGPSKERYNNFYFSSVNNMPIIKKSKGVLLLHNSWTPEKYKMMSEDQFLRQNIFLAHLISNALLGIT